MQKSLTYYRQNTLNCKSFYDEAFVMMGQCYSESGYCDVVADNFDGFMQTFDKADFLNLKLVNQVLDAAKACGGDVEQTIINDFLQSGLGGR
nr:hypothetical protein BaRGS_003140 [Batillaria attramentaria]